MLNTHLCNAVGYWFNCQLLEILTFNIFHLLYVSSATVVIIKTAIESDK